MARPAISAAKRAALWAQRVGNAAGGYSTSWVRTNSCRCVLLVGAGDVVPGHAVAVEIVHDGEARLVVLARDLEFAVVRLRLSRAARVTPLSVEAIRGRRETRA